MANADQRARAQVALNAYMEAWGSTATGSNEEALIDLVTDLGHLARAGKIDFDLVIRCAQTHLREE